MLSGKLGCQTIGLGFALELPAPDLARSDRHPSSNDPREETRSIELTGEVSPELVQSIQELLKSGVQGRQIGRGQRAQQAEHARQHHLRTYLSAFSTVRCVRTHSRTREETSDGGRREQRR